MKSKYPFLPVGGDGSCLDPDRGAAYAALFADGSQLRHGIRHGEACQPPAHPYRSSGVGQTGCEDKHHQSVMSELICQMTKSSAPKRSIRPLKRKRASPLLQRMCTWYLPVNSEGRRLSVTLLNSSTSPSLKS